MNHDLINAAWDRLQGHVRRTPILSSPALDAIAGRRILVKAECLQVTGSFKARGGWAAVSALTGAQGVIAYSSGNHAQGVARAATAHGLPSVIIMPADAPKAKIDGTRALGGEVVLYDRETEDRDAIGAEIAAARGLVLIKPFDDAQVIAGQASVGIEIAEELGDLPADVLVPCGGGGLASGIALALSARAPQMRVRTAEPEGFDDAARSLLAGHPVKNASLGGSICDAILTPSPGALTFPILQSYAQAGLVVTEDQVLRAMAMALKHLKIVVEPGGAVGLAAALFQPQAFDTDTVIAVASGGNVDPAILARAVALM
ncbi:threonine ammonia-lyase [Ketogulonicigenium vulgare]|uniref:Threonine dehydratase protein n=1 Tax=Ketogulonicigenium vulgare (strain WSH-001) TaxID=759362 RepID=F9Y7I6_KETVW|nr:threonine/serine dehydratase [Ketogulonicigenium vulgare]ADO41292.1 Threonine dehydratase [Ketogulonicigenium vulgare Y25]AEM42282.1 Threonine dehydratase protein [Ketogulonicigenium vulgare WSH-001]ALJ79901.1 threonine ammonia-lyase [Ketogulonicigenium vulgare]ANW32800.1 threonine ammonia-lyase [Ketogulonicigenium vulgare]AOZ53118.1 Threonine dehydratase [Ketogulonicigenium vulgare]